MDRRGFLGSLLSGIAAVACRDQLLEALTGGADQAVTQPHEDNGLIVRHGAGKIGPDWTPLIRIPAQKCVAVNLGIFADRQIPGWLRRLERERGSYPDPCQGRFSRVVNGETIPLLLSGYINPVGCAFSWWSHPGFEMWSGGHPLTLECRTNAKDVWARAWVSIKSLDS